MIGSARDKVGRRKESRSGEQKYWNSSPEAVPRSVPRGYIGITSVR